MVSARVVQSLVDSFEEQIQDLTRAVRVLKRQLPNGNGSGNGHAHVAAGEPLQEAMEQFKAAKTNGHTNGNGSGEFVPPLEERVGVYLARQAGKGARTRHQIAEALGEKPNRVSTALSGLQREHSVEGDGDKGWRIASGAIVGQERRVMVYIHKTGRVRDLDRTRESLHLSDSNAVSRILNSLKEKGKVVRKAEGWVAR